MTESLPEPWDVSSVPPHNGLRDPRTEGDSCGVAFVATLRGTPGRDILDAGLSALSNLDHRGSFGSDLATGDGAGILTQIPDAFLRDVIVGELPAAGSYAVGMAFLPQDRELAERAQARVAQIAHEESLQVLAWRDVPVTADLLGEVALASLPLLRHLVVADPEGVAHGIDLDRRTFRLRKRAENELDLFFASLSARTLTYKGMLTTTQLEPFFHDLSDPRYASELALVHARFSTNTFPSWRRAQPMRLIAHNGQFTSIQGNRDWLTGRQADLQSEALGDLSPLLPICAPQESDSMSFDEVVELLHLDGRSLPQSVLMMLPEAWENDAEMDPDRRAFYEYHAGVMEPWEGPASLNFTDGTLIGSVLDRNALRPARFWVTEDGLVVLASETGVLDVDPATVVRKGRVEPGRIFLVDTRMGRIVEDAEVKANVASARPYAQWLAEHEVVLDRTDRILSEKGAQAHLSVAGAQFFDHFRQRVAQATTPPLTGEPGGLVTSLRSAIGPEPNLLGEQSEHARKLVLSTPILDDGQLERILTVETNSARPSGDQHDLVALRLPALFPAGSGGAGLDRALTELCARVEDAVRSGNEVVVLSDLEADEQNPPIPSLLALSAVHQHLVASQIRSRISLVVESGDARGGQDVARLLAFGAAAINPYRALTTLSTARDDVGAPMGVEAAASMMGHEIVDLMYAFGTSTVRSYRGSQAFEAVGLAHEVRTRFFPGTLCRVGTLGLGQIAASTEFAGPRAMFTALRDRVRPVTGGEAIDVALVEEADRIRARLVTVDHRTATVGADRRGVTASYLSTASEIRVLFGAGYENRGGARLAQEDASCLEDLAQLIHDLKSANPGARVHVALTSHNGVGALAAGAAKAGADVVEVRAQEVAGTHGQPVAEWELGLAEAQQTLVLNGLRDRVVVRVEADFTTGWEVLVATLLGAEEFAFLNPAQESHALRIVQETRVHLAELGLPTLADAVGQSHLLRPGPGLEAGVDLAPVLNRPGNETDARRNQRDQDHRLDRVLDAGLITSARSALDNGSAVQLEVPVRNVNRSVGTMLGHEVISIRGAEGLPLDTITVKLTGSAGQSLGAFLPPGITLALFGDANDFVGKGLSGGRITVQPDPAAVLPGGNNVLAGNLIGYGASSGEIYLRGLAGERFAAQNSGATLVVEGIGDHGAQRMTGGTVLILGQTGRNLGAGMSGGSLIVLDLHPNTVVDQAQRSENDVRKVTHEEFEEVLRLIRNQRELTGSRLAGELLEDPDSLGPRLTRITPKMVA